jgi:uncharacterized RDD family membrane protein YckC
MEPPPLSSRPTVAAGAGFGIRLVARLIDTVYGFITSLFGGVFAGVILMILEGSGLVSPGWQGRTGGLNLAGWGLGILGSLTYHCLTEGIYGASLGKLACGLRVVSESTGPIGLAKAFKRSLAYYWDGLFFGLVGYSSMKESALNQRYGDHWAKTVVIKTREVAVESKRGWEMFALAFVMGSAAEMLAAAAGVIVHVM